MPVPNRSSENLLLDALPDDVWERLQPDFEPVTLQAGQVLYASDACMRHVYFPSTSIVSMMYMMESGNSGEIAMIGREGMTGVTTLLGAERSTSLTWVQSAGTAFRLPVQSIIAEFSRGGPLMHTMLHYLQFFIGQLVQTAACNRHASLEQRLCRWLLLSADRLPGRELAMTHELIALALGVKREGVTEAAGRLRSRGAISYRRGRIKVLDRPVLESAACECYAGSKDEAARHRSADPCGGPHATSRHAIAQLPRSSRLPAEMRS